LDRAFFNQRRLYFLSGRLLPSHGSKLIRVFPGKNPACIHLSHHLLGRKIDDKFFGLLDAIVGVSILPYRDPDHGGI
jgi:hypothetical protein